MPRRWESARLLCAGALALVGSWGLAWWLGIGAPAARANRGASATPASARDEDDERQPRPLQGRKPELPRAPEDLAPGRSVEALLPPRATLAYAIAAGAEAYLHAVVEQRGVDVVVTLLDPRGQPVVEVDSPNGAHGPEEVFAVAAEGGTHHLLVRALDPRTSGKLTVRLAALRPAGEEDRRRAEAALAFARGEALRARADAEALREAVRAYRRALALWQRLGDRGRAAFAHQRLGQTWSALGQASAALAAYEEALRAVRELGSAEDEVRLLNDSGSAHWRLGRAAEAGRRYRAALRLARRIDHRPGEATALNNLGALHDSLGESHRAVAYFDRAVAAWRALGDAKSEAVAQHNLGESLTLLGRTAEGLDAFARALALRREAGDRRGEAASLAAIGWAHLLAGDAEAALGRYDEALRLWRALGDRRGEAGTLDRQATAYRARGRQDLALTGYQASLAISRRLGDGRGQAHTLTNLGWLRQSEGEPERALTDFAQALALFRDLEDRHGEAHALVGSARAEWDRGQLERARSQLESALAIVGSVHGDLASQTLSTSYLATRYDYYALYIELLMQLDEREPGRGHGELAFEVAERARARGLLRSVGTGGTATQRSAAPALAARLETLKGELEAAEARRQALLRGAAAGETLAAASAEVRSLLLARDAVHAELAGRGGGSRRAPSLRLAEIQSRVLDEDTVLLAYALGEEHSYLWVVAHDSFRSYRLPPRAGIERLARWAHELLSASYSRSLQEQASLAVLALSKAVLGPAYHELKGRRLLILADGALHYVPFAALPVPGAGGTSSANGAEGPGWKPLLVEHEVVALPGASVLAELRVQTAGRRPAPGTLAVVADPVFTRDDPRLPPEAVVALASHRRGDRVRKAPQHPDPEPAGRDPASERLERLPFSRQEAEAILALLPRGEGWSALGAEASRSTVLSGRLADYRILHFATHGRLDSEHPALSGLVLSLLDASGRPQPGLLRAHEIADLDLPADLVVLSACRTALGRETRGEGLVGLTGSFFAAGSPRVIVSLWNVNDRATAELMARLYRGLLAEGQRPAAALRAAQLAMLREGEWQAPYYWAGFLFQGEWR